MKKLLSLLVAMIIIVTSFIVLPTVNAKAKEYIDKSSHCIYTLDSKGNATVVDGYDFPNKFYWKIPSKISNHTVTKIHIKKNKYGIFGIGCPKISIPKTVKSINKLFAKEVLEETEHMSGYVKIICYKNSYSHKFALKNKLMYMFFGKKTVYGDIAMLYAYDKVIKLYDGNNKRLFDYVNKSYVYNGREKKLKVILKRNKKSLRVDKDYTKQYINNMQIGIGSIIIRGTGNYRGYIIRQFEINPPNAKIESVEKLDNGKVRIYADNKYRLDLYDQIEYSLYSDFQNSEVLTIRRDTYYDINDLVSGKKYYFRLRKYAIADDYWVKNVYDDGTYVYGGSYQNYYYGKWSNIKSVKV